MIKHDLGIDRLRALKAEGLSNQDIADRLGVSKATIKRRLRTTEPDKEVLDFTNKLMNLIEEVPDEYCRKELNRLINRLRTHRAVSPASKYERILRSINSGARMVEEIAEDCRLSKNETVELLDEMIEAGTVMKKERGGIHNRGRKMKFQYLPANITENLSKL